MLATRSPGVLLCANIQSVVIVHLPISDSVGEL
jgi:hypothetical protein